MVGTKCDWAHKMNLGEFSNDKYCVNGPLMGFKLVALVNNTSGLAMTSMVCNAINSTMEG
ncbi:hypothetical protein AMATHDRAFT_71918 [Amanita thiersii Skay4041]|uniref:Uncharacterized protein n=1 Tax=Amanita thiersii Skay4041 TaxID=703135 RepID=A0A2A9NAB4_9AGAR|nr:hypothetical protein AMATHDRAFT_71918 [Amanita thiersii Skay4041]